MWLDFPGPRRNVKQSIAPRAVVLVNFIQAFSQTLIAGRVAKLALVIRNGLRKGIPDFIAHGLARKFPRGLFEIASEFFVSFLPSSKADDCHRRRQVAVGREVI